MVLAGRIWVDSDPQNSPLLSPRILFSDFWALFLVSLLSVWINVWAPQYWKYIKSSIRYLADRYPINQSRVGIPEKVELRTTFDGLLNERTAEDTVIKIWRLLSKAEAITIPETVLGVSGIAFCGGVFIAIAITATTASLLTLGNNALVVTPLCGVYMPNNTISVVNPIGQIMLEVEDIYRACYENGSPPACNLFPYDELFVNFTDSVECPFAGDICMKGNNSAIRFDTGYRDAVYLGLNSRYRPRYRRTATCAPLTAEKYFNSTYDPSTKYTTIKFYYGSRPDISDPSTYTIVRAPEYEQSFSPTGYNIKSISSAAREFTPIPDLKPASSDSKEYCFLAFVNTYNVNYPNISMDPIFPAKTQTLCPRSSNTCWNNTILPSSVLGCVESAEVCYPDTRTCFDVWAPNALEDMLSASWNGAEESYLTMLGLKYSNFDELLSTRHGLLLNATQQIIGNRLSQPLDPYQWKIEVKRLFDMGLLRAKMEMLAVAQGTRANIVGYDNILPADRRGICRKVKFQAKGYTNISFLGLLLAILLPLIVGAEIRGRTLLIWTGHGIWQLFVLFGSSEGRNARGLSRRGHGASG